MAKYVYAFDDSEDSEENREDGFEVVCIADLAYFEKEGYVSDAFDEERHVKLEKMGFYEMMEATYEVKGTQAEVKAILDADDDFCQTEAFTKFLSNTGE